MALPLRSLVLIGALFAVSGCEMRGGKMPYAPANFGAPDSPSVQPYPYDVPIGPLDVLKVTVFRVPDLSGEYQVDVYGKVDLPLLGVLDVRDKDPTRLAEILEQEYGNRYLNNPDVTVRVMATNQLNYTIEGGVNAPGMYPVVGRTTLLGAISQARGVQPYDSNPRRVAIFRKRDGKTVAAAFDVISIRRGQMEDPLVYPGDTIVVESSSVRSIYRDLLSAIPVIAFFNSL